MLRPSRTLPSRESFIENHIHVTTECSFCKEAFDNQDHAAARLTESSGCNHVFGASCSREWLETDDPTANRCPMCHARLFYRKRSVETYDNTPGEYESEDEGSCLSEEGERPLNLRTWSLFWVENKVVENYVVTELEILNSQRAPDLADKNSEDFSEDPVGYVENELNLGSEDDVDPNEDQPSNEDIGFYIELPYDNEEGSPHVEQTIPQVC